mgnify:CR=1 FL=1
MKRVRDEHDKEKVCSMGTDSGAMHRHSRHDYRLCGGQTISSVKLQIYTDLEVGDKIGDASIDIDSTTAPGGGIAISGSTERYQIKEAEWTTSSSKEVSVGYQPELKIRLEVADSDYAFKGTYRSSNVTIKGAEFVSASKSSGDLVIKAS